jgi:hypothetical protein
MQVVTAADEWVAEAYMETDYSTISKADFEHELKKYVVFKIMNEAGGLESVDEAAE